MFDAVNIEYAFAYLLEKEIGGRGGLNDADVFRGGEYRELGQLLEAAGKHLDKRIARINFGADEAANGGAKARLNVSAEQLKRFGEDMKKRKGGIHEDPIWEVIGALVHAVAALLDHVEGKGAAG